MMVTPTSVSTRGETLSAVVGLLLLALACAVCVSSFWRMNNGVRDSIILSSYAAALPPGHALVFGYGGETAQEKVDVLLQGREMSNVSFYISRSNSGELSIAGQDDRIRYKGKWHERGGNDSVRIFDGDSVRSLGWLGGATFLVRMDEPANTLHLDLATPIHRDIKDRAVRLVFGPQHEPVPVPVEEVFVRTTASGPQSYLAMVIDDTLVISEELDLEKMASKAAPETQVAAPQKNSDGGDAQPAAATPTIELKPGESRPFGNVELTFNHYGENRVFLYGIKLASALLLIGLALWLGPRAQWPGGVLVFGCAALLISLGLSLSARDFLFAPHEERFLKYLYILYWSAAALYCLRFPFNPADAGMEWSDLRRIAGALACFVVAYDLIDGRLDQTQWSLWPGLGRIGWVCLCFFLLLVAVNFLYMVVYFLLDRFTKYPLAPAQFWVTILFATIPLLITGLTLIVGGREAFTFVGIGRIHLPTLLLPVVIICTVLLVSAAEADSSARSGMLLVTVVVVGASICAYRIRSGDNGGTLILVVGMLSSFWLASGKRWGVPLLLTVVTLVAGLLLGLRQAERFEMAWGGEEGQVLYFDKAVNLRLARDLARAGGTTGLGFGLSVPSGLRGNLHSDLVAAYVTGVFGWVTLAAVIVAFGIFYQQLWGGVTLILNRPVSKSPASQSAANKRSVLVSIACAAIITFAVQGLWVITASLQPLLPLTGLDLQPISASGSSTLSFILILLGSVAVAHTADRALP